MRTKHCRWTSAWCALPAAAGRTLPQRAGCAALQRVRLRRGVAFALRALTLVARAPRAPQLLAPELAAFRDMAADGAALAALGVTHGALVYFRYTVQREVTPSAVAIVARTYGAPPRCAALRARCQRAQLRPARALPRDARRSAGVRRDT
jgi:hypothetical protein